MPHRKVSRHNGIRTDLRTWLSPAGAASFDVAIFVTERDAFVDAYKFWASEVEKRTRGRVTFKPSYSGALTSAVETLGAVRNGVVPIGLSAASFGSGAMPALGYLEAMGGVPNDPDGMRQALDAVNQPLTDMLQKYGVELLYTQPTFDLVVVCGGKHLKAVGDWPGTKVRAAGRWQSQQVLALGGAPTAIDPGEQYLALQNKTVDCALSVPDSRPLAKAVRGGAQAHVVAPGGEHLAACNESRAAGAQSPPRTRRPSARSRPRPGIARSSGCVKLPTKAWPISRHWAPTCTRSAMPSSKP